MEKRKISADIAVIGGGASGLAAAITAGRAGKKLKIVIAEANDRVGKKLLSTGNGQCNISNSGVLDNRYHGSSDFALKILNRKKAEEFFSSLGIVTVTDGAGRMYPYSRQSSAVLDALRFETELLGIETVCKNKISDVKKTEHGFVLRGEAADITAKTVIAATGGIASSPTGQTGYAILQSLGHSVTRLYPAIVRLKTETEIIRSLKGVKTEAAVSVLVKGKAVRTERGEILFAEYGVSGPAVLQISRIPSVSGEKSELSVDFCPDIDKIALKNMLVLRQKQLRQRQTPEFLNGFLNKRVGQTVIKLSCSKKNVFELTEEDIEEIVRNIKDFRLNVTGTRGFSSAQVTAGGVSAEEIGDRLQSLKCRGLFLCGEVINVDGDCGGFNLLWAWCSGIKAGEAAADET